MEIDRKEQTKIRELIKINYEGKIYETIEIDSIKQEILKTINSNGHEKHIIFINQYIHTKKDNKSYFNTKRKNKIVNKDNNLLNNQIDIICQDNKEDEIINKEDDDESINTEELEQLEMELFNKLNNNKKQIKYKYEYPIEKVYNIRKRFDEKFGPFGTQWIHEKQVDDKYDDIINKRSIQYDKLRAIKLPEQRSPEWFEMRNSKITASDGGTVLGDNKYEPQYTFLLKKTLGDRFKTNIDCYHGKKYEEIATMIYQYRMNVTVEEFGLLGHPTYSFLGASPDGICNQYKYDKIHKSKFVGRMLEIKCPLRREIKKTGPIKDNICPIYYWVQVQLQLECCELDECDFWQCKIREYQSREEFINDTDPDEPFRSLQFGFEKGCIIQILPKQKFNNFVNEFMYSSKSKNTSTSIYSSEYLDNYNDFIYEEAKCIYPPKIEMTPAEIDIWIAKTINDIQNKHEYKDYVFDKILYWRLENSMNVVIERDRQWFNDSLPKFKEIWNYVTILRQNMELAKLLKNYISTRKIKYNKDIMEVVKKLCENPTDSNYINFIENEIKNSDIVIPIESVIEKKTHMTNNYINNKKIKKEPVADTYLFIDD